jgi:AcrR family transcriptional regulator/mRNA-degrading endonuclease RelE of RelBE toxin-antitoxin system
VTVAGPYAIIFTPAARRRLSNLPLSAATALYEHLTGPVAGNPRRLGKPLDAPFDEVLSTRRGDYRALYTVDDTTRRREQASQNRQRIIDAARALFAARGYAATSLAQVAAEAGVAVQTVYAAFGTKASLLKHAIDVALVGDHAQVPMIEREAIKRIIAEPDPHQALAAYAALVRQVAERAGALLAAAWAAAPSDPAVAALTDELDAQRLRGMTSAAQTIAAKAAAAGYLADGITELDIRDLLWALNSPQIYSMLVGELGWSPDRFQHWLTRAWTRLLLDPP